jgi:hypothetical protein
VDGAGWFRICRCPAGAYLAANLRPLAAAGGVLCACLFWYVLRSAGLSLIRDRLEILRNLLTEDGSIWITIDDNEAHYLKIVCDEIFGRSNFVASMIWQKRYSRENREAIGDAHDYVIVYARSAGH